MKLKSKKILISSLVIGFVAIGALVGGLTYWALTSNHSNNNVVDPQATVYIDQIGKQQTTHAKDLTNVNTKKIVQIGYYQEKADGPVFAPKMPKTIVEMPNELPNKITSLTKMFQDCIDFNQDISMWNVSNVDDMSYMFNGATSFSKDLSSWTLNPDTYFYKFSAGSAFYSDQSKKPPFIKKQLTTYLDEDNQEQTTDETYLTNTSIRKITKIGFFEDGDDNDLETIIAVTMPKTLLEITTELPRQIASLEKMFYVDPDNEISDFDYNIGSWDTSNIVNMNFMFGGAKKFNQDISAWNTSNVVTMIGMFYQNTAFNQNLSAWDTSNVVEMQYMFFGATVFNGDISKWNTSNVTAMSWMFEKALVFNQDISQWDTKNVTSFYRMFASAQKFNCNISDWNTGKVTTMAQMFIDAQAFNQNIAGWITSNVTDMNNMFNGALQFNQNLSTWIVDNVTTYYDFATNSGFANDQNKWPAKFRT